MLTDRKKIEHALFPALLEWLLVINNGKDETKWIPETRECIYSLRRYIDRFIDDKSLIRRLRRVANHIAEYMRKHKFTTRKAISVMLEIVGALSEAEIIHYEDDCYATMAEIHAIFQEELPKILQENYEKYEKSYTKGAGRILEELQKQDYFKEIKIV